MIHTKGCWKLHPLNNEPLTLSDMANYYLQELPNLDKEGKRRVYPKLEINRTMDTEDVVKLMQAHHMGVAPSLVTAVLEALAETMSDLLAMGYNVNLDSLGTFSVSLQFEDDKATELVDEEDKMRRRKVGVKDVNFKPSKEWLKEIRHKTEPERKMEGVKTILKKKGTLEERIARAVEVINRKGYLTLADYAGINNMSRSAASTELRKVVGMPSSPLTTQGQYTHKVWVKR